MGIHRDVATIVAASGYTYYIEISDILYRRYSGYGCVWPPGTPGTAWVYIEILDILHSRYSGYGCVWPSGTPWDSLVYIEMWLP